MIEKFVHVKCNARGWLPGSQRRQCTRVISFPDSGDEHTLAVLERRGWTHDSKTGKTFCMTHSRTGTGQ